MSGNPRGSGQARGRGNRGRGSQSQATGNDNRGRGDGRGGGRSRGASHGRRGFSGPPAIFQENVPVQIPARLDDAQLKQLIIRTKSTTRNSKMPPRPGFGTAGTAVKLRTNFFAMSVPKGPVYDYKVDISPKTDINRVKMRLFDLLEQLVSARKLPQPLDIEIPFYEEHEQAPLQDGKIYIMSVTFKRELDTRHLIDYMEGQAQYCDYDPLPIISALNLVIQQHANKTGYRIGQITQRDDGDKERLGRSRYFFPSSERHRLAPGLEAIQGFYASVRPAFKQLLVNVNVCMAAFIEPGNLAVKLTQFHQRSRGGMPTLPGGFSKNLKVKTLHLGHRRKIKAIGTKSAQNTHFQCDELGGLVSVAEYFEKKYPALKLKHATDLPVVDIGSGNKHIWIPAELCQIEPGNAYRSKLSPKETSQMIKFAANHPKTNAEYIVNRGLPTLGFAPLKMPMDEFGLSIDVKMSEIPGRELSAPGLTYKKGKPKVANGSWNILDVKFHQGAGVSSWWVLIVEDGGRTISGQEDAKLTGLITGFQRKLQNSGMTVPSNEPKILKADLTPLKNNSGRSTAIGKIKDTLQEALTGTNKPSFVLVLLDKWDQFIYPGIKRIGDVELGIHTIHMQLEKALPDEWKKQDQYLSNVALKVNTKLGGINHLLDEKSMRWLTKKSTMMVGIDVTHPGPGSKEGTPSIAAVVASIDSHFVQFPASLCIQKSKKEMLDSLKDMLVERLQVYEEINKNLPERIIVYRDGVSEGQFDRVLLEELPQILDAFKKLSVRGRKAAYRPQLSIIICGKRHHARFFPTSSQFAMPNGNTRPGTVVDKGITGVFDFDFYLQAHAGLQGTVKATHYTVVYDEINLSADDIQVGTHELSYLYARATKAVSLIPAAYYADLACERGRCYLNDFLADNQVSSSSSRANKSKQQKEEEMNRVYKAAQKVWGQGLHSDLRGSMFYI